MRYFEAINKFTSRPIVYLDMDGVLADFFGTVARHHGVDHWRKARKTHDRIDKIARDPGFFESLPLMPKAKELVTAVIDQAGSYSILSSPLQSAVEQSSDGKSRWLRRRFPNQQPESVLYDHEKYKYARQADQTPNILIDDWDTNIHLWEKNGGIGILYSADRLDQAVHELHVALSGNYATFVKSKPDITDRELGHASDDLWTAKDVIDYVCSIHKDYHLIKPIKKFAAWKVKPVATRLLHTPEYYDQDDPYRRVIDLNWKHINNITADDLKTKPIVIDNHGWVLDGNHRLAAARARGLKHILALVPIR